MLKSCLSVFTVKMKGVVRRGRKYEIGHGNTTAIYEYLNGTFIYKDIHVIGFSFTEIQGSPCIHSKVILRDCRLLLDWVIGKVGQSTFRSVHHQTLVDHIQIYF